MELERGDRKANAEQVGLTSGHTSGRRLCCAAFLYVILQIWLIQTNLVKYEVSLIRAF